MPQYNNTAGGTALFISRDLISEEHIAPELRQFYQEGRYNGAHVFKPDGSLHYEILSVYAHANEDHARDNLIEKILEYIAITPHPVLMCGDLNATTSD